ncbi:LOW QUALITY PROTEIN: monocarboxylate transporter 12-B-like [Aplochiton taeniatus]
MSPPDGGWGWMIIASCFLVTICTRAVTRCISIFFVEFQLHFARDYSGTAWIHSLVDSTTMLCAPLGSFIGNRLSCRTTVILGGLLSSSGMVLSSFATSLEFLYCTLGVLTVTDTHCKSGSVLSLIPGLGFALSYTPAVAMVGTYFSERKALAYGIAMSGSGIGTFVLAPAVQLLIEQYSWRGALLILGGFVSHLCVCGALMRPLGPGGRATRTQEVDVEKGSYLVDSRELCKTKMEAKPGYFDVGEMELHTTFEMGTPENLTMAQMKLAEAMLSSRQLFDPSLADINMLEGRVVTSNKLTNKMLAEIKLSDPKLVDGGTLEDMKLVENMNVNNKLSGSSALDAKRAESKLFVDAKPKDMKLAADPKLAESKLIVDANPKDMKLAADAKLAESKLIVDANPVTLKLASDANARQANSVPKPATVPLCPIVTPSKAASRGLHCLFLQSMKEFDFLFMPDFLLLSVSFLFLAYGCSVPIVYLVPYALSVGVPHQKAAFLMSILGVNSIVGNITFGWLTDRKALRQYRTVSYMVAVGLEGLTCLLIPLLHSFSLLVPFSMLYGYFDGAYVALIPVVTSDVVGSSYLSSALGVVYFLHAIPYLVSPPIGGWLVDRTGHYTAAFFLSAFSLISSPLFLGTVMLIRRCWTTGSHSLAGRGAGSEFTSFHQGQYKEASTDGSKKAEKASSS